jgi:hypothetical protein
VEKKEDKKAVKELPQLEKIKEIQDSNWWSSGAHQK